LLHHGRGLVAEIPASLGRALQPRRQYQGIPSDAAL